MIHKLFQDGKGYIWIATDNGISYFDGMSFSTFHHDSNKPGTIASDLVKVIYTDSRGTCWVGNSNKLQIFDYENNVFRDFPLQYPFFSKTYYVSSILESPDKEKLLVSVPGVGIVVYDIKTHIIDLKTTDKLQNIYDTKYLGNMFFDSEGYLWTFAEQGNFYRLNFKQKTISKELWSPELTRLSKEIAVSAIVEDPVTRNLLIGTFKHGLFIYDRSLGYIRRAKGMSSPKYQIRTLLAEKKKRPGSDLIIWVGTEEYGLKIFDRKDEDIITTNFQSAPIDLDNCKVHSIVQDTQGNIWVGVFQKGLLIIPKSTYGFEYLKLSESHGVMSENQACVTSMTRDKTGDLWVGTDGGGLFRITNTGKITRYTTENTPLPNNAILTLASDKRGTLWISTYMGGITTYNPSSSFRSYSHELELQKVFSSIYDPKNDKLYLGTLGYGVKVLSIPEDRIETFPKSVNQGWINALSIDASGTLWVGRSKGVRCYNTQTGREKNIKLAEKMSETQIYSFLHNPDGSTWIGSADGLVGYNKNDEISSWSQKDGLPSNMIFAIQQDLKGVLWLSTGNGLARFDPQNQYIKNFYAYDGLQDNEFRMGATFKDKDGKMFFGGINGITAFYSHKVEGMKQPVPNIYFSQLVVLNKSVNYDESLGKNNILDRHISQARVITLKKSQNVFSLEFAVMEYTNPRKVVYGYMLKGFDPNWLYTNSDHRSATYTNLPDGRYTFRVKAFFEGNSNDKDVVYNEINIHILPPWYKTWWAYLIYLAFIMATVWAFSNFLIRRRLRIQEHIEFEKKEMKLRMFTDISHEIRTPLTMVINPLKSMRETETDHKRKDMYNLMYRNSLRILRLINQLMDMRKIDNHQLQMHFNQTDLIFFIKDIMKSFEQVAIMRNIDFRLVSNRETLDAWIDQGNFDKVLFNIISNAFKFTPDNGYMLISIDTFVNNNRQSGSTANGSEYIELRFENSGSFIDESELERIFDRYYQSNNSNNSGSGIGLHLAKMIVHLHHGTIDAKNVENGVAFMIRIPLGNAHLSPKELSTEAKHKDLYSSIRSDEKLPSQAEYIEIPETEDENSVLKASKSKKTLVFVDDDADMGKYIKQELSDKYNIEVCLNSKEAWKVISTTIPDAVITDLIMPKVDGISLCRKIRQNPETNYLPVIILTAQTDEESEQKSIENGADSYLTKPVSLELLKITIAQAIQTRDMIRNKYRSNVKLDLNEIQMSSPDSRLIANVIETIRKNIENARFSVDDLSHEVGLSRVHLNRKLKENINISPSNLIKSIRLKQAAYLLIKNKVNVSEIAYKVGFSSPSYFSSNFHEYFGMAPSEFVLKYMDSDDKEILNKLFEG